MSTEQHIGPGSIVTKAGVGVDGPGYLGGEAPEGRTTVGGVPVSADVDVFYELDTKDWQHVASTTSQPDGTWSIVGLHPDKKFNVVARHASFGGVIAVDVQPSRTDVVTLSGAFTTNDDFDGVAGFMTVESGMPPFTASVIDPLPYGLTPLVVDGRKLIVEGQAGADDNGLWQSTLRVTASNGVWVDVAVQVEIDVQQIYLQPGFIAQAFATVQAYPAYPDWDPAEIDTNAEAAVKYAHFVAMWAMLEISNPPLIFKRVPSGSSYSIPLTVGEFPIVSIVGTKWRVKSSNGAGNSDSQNGLYQFLDANGQEVFALNTYRGGSYNSRLQWRLAGGPWSAVPNYSYGNGHCDVTFDSAGAVGIGNYAGSGSGWGNFSASFDAESISTVRCSVTAETRVEAAWTYLELLDDNVND